MTVHWMLYVLAVGVLVTLGALAMEGAMRSFRLPQRGVWAAAMVLGLAMPAAARWMPRGTAPASAASAGNAAGEIRLPDLPSAAAERLTRMDLQALDGPLAAGWTASSAIAVLLFLAASAALARRRRGWRAGEVDGVPVLLSPATGPAVVGLFRGRIVLPAWVLDAEPAERALLLEHEREHLRASDPRLLALGLACVAAAPWNPAAWYALRRLRLAMEVDCDARVLARRADVRAYGALLLEVGRRASASRPLVAAAAFSEPVSFLERRIRIMTSPRASRPLLRAAGFGAVALALTAAACRTPEPAGPTAPADGAPAFAADAATTEQAVREEAVRRYPQLARGVGDSATVILVYDHTGNLVDHRMNVRGDKPQHRPVPSAFIPADLKMVQFAVGEIGPDPVRVFTLRQLTPEAAAALPVNAETVVVTTRRTAAGAP